MRRAVPIAMVCLAALGRAARADEDPSAFDGARVALELEVGAATPIGFGGINLEVAPLPWLALEGGLGESAEHTQSAVMARLYPAGRGTGISVGAGVSAGGFERDGRAWDRAVWSNLEVSGHIALSSAVQVRLFGGWGQMVNAAAEGGEGVGLPYAGIGVRTAIGL